jgi:hypothetical protein
MGLGHPRPAVQLLFQIADLLVDAVELPEGFGGDGDLR